MANYSMRADGTAANKAAAEDGDKTDASECMNLSVHNGESFSAGDVITLWSNGGVYRGTLAPPDEGSSGTPIEYVFDAVSPAQVNGADLFDSGWSVYSGSIWEVAATSTVRDLYYNGTQGSKQVSKDAPSAEGEWFWESSKLYLYAASNPGTLYTSPGVEGTIRDYGVDLEDRSYITLTGNGGDIRYSWEAGIWNRGGSGNRNYNVTIDNLRVHNIAYGFGSGQGFGIRNINCQNLLISECEVYYCGWNGIQLTVWAVSEAAFTGNVIEYCYAHDCDHGCFDTQVGSSASPLTGTVHRYCYARNGTVGFYNSNSDSGSNGMSDSRIEYCIAIQNLDEGIKYAQSGSGAYHDNLVIVGCLAWDNGQRGSGTVGYGISAEATDGVIKNNICFDNQATTGGTTEMTVSDGGGTANDVDYNCVWNTSLSDLYKEDGTNYTHAEYQSFGQQVNGISADPKCADPENENFTLLSTSPCIGGGEDLGASYDTALLPGSSWPDGVLTGDQDAY